MAQAHPEDNSESTPRCPARPNDAVGAGSGYARRLALLVEYDGSRYAGFQLQAGPPTVQGELERALARFTGEAIRIRAASRTDSGAHAQGQVVDFMTHSAHPADRFPRALNFYLAEDIRVQAAYEVRVDFHSRRDAASRTYRYCILNRRWPSPLWRHSCFWVPDPLDIGRMATAARSLVGCHDFRRFSADFPEEKSAVRAVHHWEVWRENETVIIECEANGFLRHQIRRANALLVEVGKGRLPESIVKDILDGEFQGKAEWPSLPALGLCLIKVTYPNFWSQVRTTYETDQHLLPQNR